MRRSMPEWKFKECVRLLCAQPPDLMRIAKLSDVYFADVQFVEIASKSLINLVEKSMGGSSPSKSGDAATPASQGTSSTARDDGEGSQSEEPASAIDITKVTADTSSPATDTQDSTMKGTSPPQRDDAEGIQQEASKTSSALSAQPRTSGNGATAPVDLLGMVPQHLAQVERLEVCQIL